MFARDVERFHAVLGLEDVVAMGVKQIVEQLHVEFVVLDDQHGLGFGIHDSVSPPPARAQSLLKPIAASANWPG